MSSLSLKTQDSINLTEMNVAKFGFSISSKATELSKKIMENVNSKDLGDVGSDLKSLILNLEKNSLDKIESKGFLSKIFNKSKFTIKELKLNLTNINPQIENISLKLNDHTFKLEKELIILDNFSKANLENIKELENLQRIGKEKHIQLIEEEIPALKKKKEEDTENSFELSEQIMRLVDFSNRLGKRLLELDQMKTVCQQTSHQIQMIKSGHNNMISKIQDCENIALPLWRSSFTIALVSQSQKESIEMVKGIKDFTNTLITKNAENLHINSTEIAREASTTLIETDVLQQSVEKLSETFREVAEIYNTNINALNNSQEKLKLIQDALVNFEKTDSK